MYIYLHGFASSPRSAKAQHLRDRFQQQQQTLIVPDLNQDDFSHLTLSRQIHQTSALFTADARPITLIGSSFGGLTAAWLGERYSQVQRLVLLAPAFGFLDHWLPRLGRDAVDHWQAEQVLPIYHYGEQRQVSLHYGFIHDAMQYSETALQRPVPTLILHGRHDEVIPIQASYSYASQRPWVTLMELQSDHSLQDVTDDIWQAIQAFCAISPPDVIPAAPGD